MNRTEYALYTKLFLLLSIFFIPPLFALAQFNTGTDIVSILDVLKNIFNTVIPILMVLATVIFLWGIIMYITASGDEKRLASSRQYIIWGLVALLTMAAVWGLVNVLLLTFTINTLPTPKGPIQI